MKHKHGLDYLASSFLSGGYLILQFDRTSLEILLKGQWSILVLSLDGETMETVTELIFLGSKITADGDCGHEIKRCLLLGKKAMTKLDSILKSRNITLPTEVCLVKATAFPIFMYGCESWTIKKAQYQIIDTFELWCWRTLLIVTGSARKSNQSILKDISPEYSFEGQMLKLKLQYFGHPMGRTNSLEMTHAGKDRGQEKVVIEDEIVGRHHPLT